MIPAETDIRPKRHRHRWVEVRYADTGQSEMQCLACPVIRDEAAARRGRQSRNYGNRAELDIARRYGGRKVGHIGGKADVIGATRKVQIKTSRRAVPPMWREAFAGLDTLEDERLPVLLLRFVRPGSVGPDDYLVIRAADFMAWYGPDKEETK